MIYRNIRADRSDLIQTFHFCILIKSGLQKTQTCSLSPGLRQLFLSNQQLLNFLLEFYFIENAKFCSSMHCNFLNIINNHQAERSSRASAFFILQFILQEYFLIISVFFDPSFGYFAGMTCI